MALPAILVTGTAKYSLGESFISQYCSQVDHLPVISLDRQLNPGLGRFEKVKAVQISLSPFDYSDGYGYFQNKLKIALRKAVNTLSCDSISSAILSAGLYASGPFIKHTQETREGLLGVNIIGKYEVLYSTLFLNRRLGFDNSTGFTLVDIGSIHGLRPSHLHSLYSPSKAIGLGLCAALQDGEEVRRCVHIAPGPIDTCMLHRNYWIIKEKGPAEFLEFMLLQHEELYHDIFVKCRESALKEACAIKFENFNKMMDIFRRYRHRRQLQLRAKEGILKPTDVADLLVNIVLDDKGNPPGVYILTAPEAKMQVKRVPFSQFSFLL